MAPHVSQNESEVFKEERWIYSSEKATGPASNARRPREVVSVPSAETTEHW
jgi:hypothetical protein